MGCKAWEGLYVYFSTYIINWKRHLDVAHARVVAETCTSSTGCAGSSIYVVSSGELPKDVHKKRKNRGKNFWNEVREADCSLFCRVIY